MSKTPSHRVELKKDVPLQVLEEEPELWFAILDGACPRPHVVKQHTIATGRWKIDRLIRLKCVDEGFYVTFNLDCVPHHHVKAEEVADTLEKSRQQRNPNTYTDTSKRKTYFIMCLVGTTNLLISSVRVTFNGYKSLLWLSSYSHWSLIKEATYREQLDIWEHMKIATIHLNL